MFGRLKKLFTPKDGVDLTRRKFIRDAGALAALTVVATSLPSLLKVKEIQEQVLSGLVENQTFYIDETIFIEIDNLVIRNCTFIASRPLDPMIHVSGKVSGLEITRCIFNNQPSKDSLGIRFDGVGSSMPPVDFKPTAPVDIGKRMGLPSGTGIKGFKS